MWSSKFNIDITIENTLERTIQVSKEQRERERVAAEDRLVAARFSLLHHLCRHTLFALHPNCILAVPTAPPDDPAVVALHHDAPATAPILSSCCCAERSRAPRLLALDHNTVPAADS